MLLISAILLAPFVEILPKAPRTSSLTSLDWSGYSVASDLVNPQPTFTGLNGSWIVPTITVSQRDTYSAAWIGIGGQFDDTLIQTGTEHDSTGGQATYSIWYELLPADSVTIVSIDVNAGDQISAYIGLVNSTTNLWLIVVEDLTDGMNFSTTVMYDSSRLSAEWVVEKPTVNNVLSTLADFGTITFTGISVSTENRVGTISDFSYTQLTMYNRQNIHLVTVSSFAPGTSSFSVEYLG
jgi:hypothetical protein